MIITNKQFPNYRKFEMMYEGRPLSMEVGKLAELCNAAVLVKYGETTVLVTCTASARPKDGSPSQRRHRLLPPLRGLQREALRRRPHPRQLHAP